ncbi:MAG TPA: hypothetical protein VEX38_05360 [Fimbriimonadaceae bacterium]|nr:hypothetical protein [Fimbriimonadaceae bacterium]
MRESELTKKRKRWFDPLVFAFLVPLTPWPVLIWINSLEEYMYSARHSAEPLFAVGSEALIAILVTSLLGLISVLMDGCPAHFAVWCLFGLANAWLLCTYVFANAVAYV